MTYNKTRLELIDEGKYFRIITTFQCQICGKVFGLVTDMKQHLREHTEKEFEDNL